MTFLEIWVIYAVFGISVFSVVFVWAVRARQFSDLDRGRHLALMAARHIEKDGEPHGPPGRIDRLMWIALVAIACALFASAICLGIGSG